MVSGPKALEQEEPAFLPTEKDTLQKSMTLMRRLLVDAQGGKVRKSTEEETCSDCSEAALMEELERCPGSQCDPAASPEPLSAGLLMTSETPH
ncbi:unnamed protein product [Boreogadus saida]